MSWFKLFVLFAIALVFALSLWGKLIRILDRNQIKYPSDLKRTMLREILLHVAQFMLLFLLLYLGLSYLKYG